jgi:CelD/BcsL family acetyltransferase involved in cellulose biosynthesis
MVPRAASAGRLSGHILSLNERPIAYMLGLLGQDRVYLALKSSFDESVAALSPGHVLKKLGICRLIERGAVAFDFMGRCDTHKMYWTDQTYEVATLAIYNASWRGRAAWLKRRIGGLRRTIPDEAPIPTRKDRDKPSAPAIKDNPGAGAGGTD